MATQKAGAPTALSTLPASGPDEPDELNPHVYVLQQGALGLYADVQQQLLADAVHLPNTCKSCIGIRHALGTSIFERDARDKERADARRQAYNEARNSHPYAGIVYVKPSVAPSDSLVLLPLHALLCLQSLCDEVRTTAQKWASRFVLKSTALADSVSPHSNITLLEMVSLIDCTILLKNTSLPPLWDAVVVPDIDAATHAVLMHLFLKHKPMYVACMLDALRMPPPGHLVYPWLTVVAAGLEEIKEIEYRHNTQTLCREFAVLPRCRPPQKAHQ